MLNNFVIRIESRSGSDKHHLSKCLSYSSNHKIKSGSSYKHHLLLHSSCKYLTKSHSTKRKVLQHNKRRNQTYLISTGYFIIRNIFFVIFTSKRRINV